MNSIWSETCQIPRRDSLPGDLVCDAAVIGAGMAGILSAAGRLQDSRAGGRPDRRRPDPEHHG